MFRFFLIAGLVCIFVSGIYIGAWTDGDRQRANFYSETPKNRKQRVNIGLLFGLIGVISLLIAGIIYFN
ncbi:DUF5316 family protein [Margalitia sp. FSL K6-0131]|uniref:DUF5316 family protein n=1 Tax=Margalitia sp. FSL K6-0131 TaxID=2954604 RepID=UPI0030FC2A30